MFRAVLIANRGEIACRIISTARAFGMRTVAVHSEPDRDARHVRLADEAYAIGPAAAGESYLNIARILEAAKASGADCIHPGYGFLAENPEFAEACTAAGLAFIGPPPSAIRAMGLKTEAKALVAAAGVPVVPGYDGARQSADAFANAAKDIGYPLVLKPAAGGGGKGMRRVSAPEELSQAFEAGAREALSAFGNGDLLAERWLERARHIEVQILADRHGGVVPLFERDCSLQRRHQKIIEEAPAPGMTPHLRARMQAAAVDAARAVAYEGAGTVEFLVEGSRLDDQTPFYFMEMNTRLQVEHPVTEAITGLDLVAWQFRVAAGEPVRPALDGVRIDGHAMEARVYAEDPERGFLPASGRLVEARWPQGTHVRVDRGVDAGDVVSPHYDPMIAKVIAHAPTREAARERLRSALAETRLVGPRTNLSFLHHLLGDPDVVRADMHVAMIDAQPERFTGPARQGRAVLAGALALAGLWPIEGEEAGPDAPRPPNPWDARDGWQLGGARRQVIRVLVDGDPQEVSLDWDRPGVAASLGTVAGSAEAGQALRPGAADVEVYRDGARMLIIEDLRQTELTAWRQDADRGLSGEGGGLVAAPMHGRVSKLFVATGARVAKGDRLLVLEAMKMEHVLHAHEDGVVESIACTEGAQVEQGALLVSVTADVPA